MKAKAISGSVVTLKLKTSDFRSRTRRRTLNEPSQLADTLFKVGRELLVPEVDGTRFRLIGIGFSALQDHLGDSGDLLDPNAIRRATAERAMDKARAKFGGDAVVKGRALKPRPKQVPDPGAKPPQTKPDRTS